MPPTKPKPQPKLKLKFPLSFFHGERPTYLLGALFPNSTILTGDIHTFATLEDLAQFSAKIPHPEWTTTFKLKLPITSQWLEYVPTRPQDFN